MLDAFDYKEPACPLCDGKGFYNPQPDAPRGRIPVGRVMERLDGFFHKNDYAAAGRHLQYWLQEAVALRDKAGELAVQNELIGYYRKQSERDKGLAAVARALTLVEELAQGDMASGATVFINAATAYKAFAMPAEALSLYRRAEQIYAAVLAENDTRRAALYNNMALTLADMGQPDEAETAYRAALAVLAAADGSQADAAITYINLAHLYDSIGNTAPVADCLQQALDLLHSDTLPHDGYYAFVLEKCAPSFGYFGQTAVAHSMQKEAAAIYARA